MLVGADASNQVRDLILMYTLTDGSPCHCKIYFRQGYRGLACIPNEMEHSSGGAEPGHA